MDDPELRRSFGLTGLRSNYACPLCLFPTAIPKDQQTVKTKRAKLYTQNFALPSTMSIQNLANLRRSHESSIEGLVCIHHVMSFYVCLGMQMFRDASKASSCTAKQLYAISAESSYRTTIFRWLHIDFSSLVLTLLLLRCHYDSGWFFLTVSIC